MSDISILHQFYQHDQLFSTNLNCGMDWRGWGGVSFELDCFELQVPDFAVEL